MHPLPVELNMITVIGIEDEILDEFRNSQTLSRDERITKCAHHYELRLSKSSTLTIHERWKSSSLAQPTLVHEDTKFQR